MSWDVSVPADSDPIRLGASVIRSFKVDIATALSVEGQFPGPTPSTPVFYYSPLYNNTVNRPAPSAVPGRLFINTDTGTVQRDRGDSSHWDDIATLQQSGDMKQSFLNSDHAGWLLCDGRSISRTTYANLFSAIGVAAGSGDGATTFNIPDMRGRFTRGLNRGTGNDPDAASRTAQNSGGNTGDNIGSLQADQFGLHGHGVNDPSHSHSVKANGGPGSSGPTLTVDGTGGTGSTNPSSTGISIQSSGGNETRPKNVAVNYFIKY